MYSMWVPNYGKNRVTTHHRNVVFTIFISDEVDSVLSGAWPPLTYKHLCWSVERIFCIRRCFKNVAAVLHGLLHKMGHTFLLRSHKDKGPQPLLFVVFQACFASVLLLALFNSCWTDRSLNINSALEADGEKNNLSNYWNFIQTQKKSFRLMLEQNRY